MRRGAYPTHDAAHATGLSFPHLAAVERGAEPLLDTDARDLGAVLGVPAVWLRDGWTGDEPS